MAVELKRHCEGTRLRIRLPSRTTETNTAGWAAVIGDLGKEQPTLEIWLDRFTGHPDRKLYACFRSSARPKLIAVTKRVEKNLWPVRVVTSDDTTEAKYLHLLKNLKKSHFKEPILEKYNEGETFYGIYDPTPEFSDVAVGRFRQLACSFFEEVARALPNASADDEKQEVYPQCENRKLVTSHLQRERSRLLATSCKIRDDFTCQVCHLKFEERYGSLGKDFAEAHHLVPLSQLRDKVKTRIEDLTTVCANCHRMLHRMEGKRNDVSNLRAIFRKHQGKRK